MNDQIKSLHACWCAVTGQELNARATERLFYELWKMDFTVDDLQTVLKYMLTYNRKHPACPMKIQVHKCLGDLSVFASVLAEAKAIERNRIKSPTPKQQVLQSFRPTVEELGNGRVHHISELLRKPI